MFANRLDMTCNWTQISYSLYFRKLAIKLQTRSINIAITCIWILQKKCSYQSLLCNSLPARLQNICKLFPIKSADCCKEAGYSLRVSLIAKLDYIVAIFLQAVLKPLHILNCKFWQKLLKHLQVCTNFLKHLQVLASLAGTVAINLQVLTCKMICKLDWPRKVKLATTCKFRNLQETCNSSQVTPACKSFPV